MPTIQDEEFGTITIRKSARAHQVRIRVAPNGTLRASMPLYAPLFLLKRLIKSSRPELRAMLKKARPRTTYTNGQKVGKSHTLIVRAAPRFRVELSGQQIIITAPENTSLADSAFDQKIRPIIISALRTEAKSYLPRRLRYLSEATGLSYAKVRFSHASSRWGSCSSQKTISLNIALMKLPFELIDYVLLHELAHTRHMNHSDDFWQLVKQFDPQYKAHRLALRKEDPSI